MEVTHSHCAGLDVHKKTVVACCLSPGEGGELVKETRTFSTMTQDLLNLGDWLFHKGITHVAMESTGEYWKPVYNLLEDGFTVLVVNAQHIKNVPGRKTDVKDAEWIADLLRHATDLQRRLNRWICRPLPCPGKRLFPCWIQSLEWGGKPPSCYWQKSVQI